MITQHVKEGEKELGYKEFVLIFTDHKPSKEEPDPTECQTERTEAMELVTPRVLLTTDENIEN